MMALKTKSSLVILIILMSFVLAACEDADADLFVDLAIDWAHEKGLLQEIFGSGTAAVVAPVSDFTYKGKQYDLPPMSEQKIGALAKAEINGLRSKEITDTHGWVVPVKNPLVVGSR